MPLLIPLAHNSSLHLSIIISASQIIDASDIVLCMSKFSLFRCRKVVNSDIENTGSSKQSTRDKYKAFFKKREDKKKELYTQVGLFSLAIVIVGIILDLVSSSQEELYTVFWYCTLVPGNFFRVLGVCMLSTVPPAELDVFKYLMDENGSTPVTNSDVVPVAAGEVVGVKKNSYYARVAVMVTLGVALVLCGVALNSVSLSVLPLLFGIVILYSAAPRYFPSVRIESLGNGRPYETLVLKLACLGVGLCVEIAIFDVYTQEATIINIIYTVINLTCALHILFIIYMDYYFGHYAGKTRNTKHYHYASLAGIARHSNDPTGNSDGKDPPAGWGAQSLYNMLYLLFPIYGTFAFIVNGAYNVYIKENPLAILGPFLVAFFDLLPVVAALILGLQRSFALLARVFELERSRLQAEGAFMAALVKQTTVYDYLLANHAKGNKNGVLWVKRRREDDRFGSNNSGISRSFWMKATLDDVGFADASSASAGQCQLMRFRVSYKDDMDCSWIARYDENLDLVVKREAGKCPSREVSFNQWLESNFEGKADKVNEAIVFDREKREVMITYQLDSLEGSAARDKRDKLQRNGVLLTDEEERLLTFAQDNLRYFDMAKFTNNLFQKSPRELRDDNDEKDKVYAQSTPLKPSDRINYFISHSWSDNASEKSHSLKEFVEKFRKTHWGRYPTVWLDKVCINQKKPEKGVEVLPINIGACDKFLIIFSNTYLKRLWCIWELFTLFTFTVKEMAIERIELIALGILTKDDIVKELREFDPSNAHCFDPNEEFRLRNIIEDIGVDKLKERLKEIAEEITKSKRFELQGNAPSKSTQVSPDVSGPEDLAATGTGTGATAATTTGNGIMRFDPKVV